MRRLTRWLFRLAMVAAVLSGVVYFGRDLLFHRLDEEIRLRIETMLADHYPSLAVQVRSARLIEGRGIVVRGVRIGDRDASADMEPMVKIDELFCICETRLPQFLTEDIAVSHVEFRGLQLRAARDPDGTWNVTRLLPLPKFDDHPLGIEVRDASIEVADAPGVGRPLLLRNVALDVAPEVPDRHSGSSIHGDQLPRKFQGTFSSEYCRQGGFEGTFWPDDKAWAVKGTISHFDFSRRLQTVLPRELSELLEPLAALDVQAHVTYDVRSPAGADDPIQVRVTGRLLDGRIDDPRFPYALTNLRGEIDVDNQGLRLTELTASSGHTQLRLSCAVHGFESDSPIALRAVVKQLSLDHRVYTMLPNHLREDWDKFSPSGTLNADLSLAFDGSQWQPELHVECLNVAFVYEKFPYRLDHGVGHIHLVDDRLWSDSFRVEANGQTVGIAFDFRDPGPKLTGWMQAYAHGPVPIDEQLLSALDDDAEQAIRSLRPSGAVVVQSARLEKRDPDQEEFHKKLELELRDCAIKFEHFPYPIHKIRGKLICDDDAWTLRDLVGYNDSGYIICHGSWQPKEAAGSLLVLDFDCGNVRLENELREALKPSSRQLWDKLQPRGILDQLAINVRFDSELDSLALDIRGQKWPPRPNADNRGITLQPVWCPHPLDDVTGSIRFRDGVVDLERVKARHGNTTFDLSGRSTFDPDGAWSLQLAKLTATHVEFDRDLLKALPPDVGETLTSLNLAGRLSISGRLAFAGREGVPESLTADWDLLVDVENGRLGGEAGLQNIRGGVRLFGRKDRERFFSRGELNIDSLMHQGVQLTQVQGPLWIDPGGVVFGTWVPLATPKAVPKQVSARAFGGTLSLDARVANQTDTPFTLEARLNEASLVELARELGTGPSNVSGKVFTHLRLTGNRRGVHSWRGGGAVRLTDADVYQLPQMVALLKLLVIEPPNTTAFTTSEIDFRVEGDRIYFDRINFNGDAISLKGRGEMSLQRELNVHFYALVGRDEFWPAFLRPIRSETAKSLLLIQVAGTLEDPKLTRRAFPHVEETLQQLFPEAAREKAAPAASAAWQSLDPRRLIPK